MIGATNPFSLLAQLTDPASLNGQHDAPAAESESSEPPAFPVDALPPSVRRFVLSGAAARDIPPDFIATPLLGFAGAVIGDRVVLQVKRGQVERAVLWTCVVGGPGSGKTPGADYARTAIDAIQDAHWTKYQQRVEAAKDQDGGTAPRLASIFTSDATLEAVGMMLAHSRGLVLYRDELAGWTASFDAYRKGGDRQTWLALWSGSPLKNDRKHSPPTYVPRPVISIAGGVQPARLFDLRGGPEDDGFPDRFLLSFPWSKAIGWTDDEDDQQAVDTVTAIFQALHARWDQDPITVAFSASARDLFKQYVNDNALITDRATGLAAGWSAKAPRHLARIALVLHCLTHATNPAREIDDETLVHAIELVDYYRTHFVRCLPHMRETGASQPAGDAARVMRLLRQAPPDAPWVARSTLMDGTRLNAARLTAALDQLETAGVAVKRIVPTGTNYREEWRAVAPEEGTGAEDSENSEDSPSHVQFSELSESSEGTLSLSGVNRPLHRPKELANDTEAITPNGYIFDEVDLG